MKAATVTVVCFVLAGCAATTPEDPVEAAGAEAALDDAPERTHSPCVLQVIADTEETFLRMHTQALCEPAPTGSTARAPGPLRTAIAEVLQEPELRINKLITRHCKFSPAVATTVGRCVSEVISATVLAYGENRPPSAPPLCSADAAQRPPARLLPTLGPDGFGTPSSDPAMEELRKVMFDPKSRIHAVMVEGCGGGHTEPFR